MDHASHTHTTNYRSWVEISTHAINHNIAQYKKLIGDKLLAPVIKGNAYGHGIVEVGQLCQKNSAIEWVCVANISEAILLRHAGFTKSILVLSYIGFDKTDIEFAIANNISFVLYDTNTANMLAQIAKTCNKICNVHIKIDTGLSRLGVRVDTAMEFVAYVQSLKQICIEGVWTHFAQSPSTDRTFTNLQAHLFFDFVQQLKNKGIPIPYVHSCNSSAISTVNTACDNFFRLGIGLYGYWASEYVTQVTQQICKDFTLLPTLTWKSRIFCIKQIPKGSFVGYDRTHQVHRDSKVAVIPVGYYDGYDRRLSNWGRVIIHGQTVPILGIVCMNVITFDITDIEQADIGDEVTLLGNFEGVRVGEIAKRKQINPREITTKIIAEIPRVIIE